MESHTGCLSPPHARTLKHAHPADPERHIVYACLHAPCGYLERLMSMRGYALHTAPVPPLLLTLSHPPQYGTHMLQ